MPENLLLASERLKQAFKQGVPSNVGPGQQRDEAIANHESDEAREARSMAEYKHGVKSVPKTGPAILHKGEAVIPAERNPMNKNKNHRLDDRRDREVALWGYLAPSYKNGTASVPETGPAVLHKGEKVVPAKKAGLFDAVSAPVLRDCTTIRKAASGGHIICEYDHDGKVSGEHIISTELYDLAHELLSKHTGDSALDLLKVHPDSGTRDSILKLLIAHHASVSDATAAKENPTDSADKVRSASPNDIAGGVERRSNPMPKVTGTKASAV